MTTKPKQMTVAIIGTRGYPSYYGGFETAVRKLAPFLAAHDWKVRVYGRPGTTQIDDKDLDPRIETPVTRGVQSRSFSTLTYGFTSCMHAIVFKPDVALVMNVANGFWLPLLKVRGIPTIVNVDGIEWDRAKWSWFARAVFRAGARMTAIFATEIVVDAKEIGRRWTTQFNREGIYIPYGGDVPGELPLEPGLLHRGYVLVVARFVPENTVPEFLIVAGKIAESWPVVFVGSSGYGGDIEDKVRLLVSGSENVHWLGHVSDDQRLLALWQHAGVYFHGHSVGGTNPALVQAMACGVPIVARDTVYNREVLGSKGSFVAPEPKLIGEAISFAMRDSVDNVQDASSRNRARALAEYSWETVCRSYESVLLGVLRRIDPRGHKSTAS